MWLALARGGTLWNTNTHQIEQFPEKKKNLLIIGKQYNGIYKCLEKNSTFTIAVWNRQ